MSKTYKNMANQFFKEKIEKEFPDFTVDESNITTGKVTLSDEGMSIALLYNAESNHFVIGTLTIEPSAILIVTNDRLVEICQTIKDGGLVDGR